MDDLVEQNLTGQRTFFLHKTVVPSSVRQIAYAHGIEGTLLLDRPSPHLVSPFSHSPTVGPYEKVATE